MNGGDVDDWFGGGGGAGGMGDDLDFLDDLVGGADGSSSSSGGPGGASGEAGDWISFAGPDEAVLPLSELNGRDALIFLVDMSDLMFHARSRHTPTVPTVLSSSASSTLASQSASANPSASPAILSGPTLSASASSSSSSSSSANPNSLSSGWQHASSSLQTSNGASSASSSSSSSFSSSSFNGGGHHANSSPRPTAWHDVIDLILMSIKNKVITSPDDYIGICLFGTRHLADNANHFEHVHVFSELGEPSARMVQTVQSLHDQSVIDTIGVGSAASHVELDKALWVCSTMFANAASSMSSSSRHRFHKRIMLFTCNDKPYRDADARQRCLRKGKDLREQDIKLELLPLSRTRDQPFQMSLLYKELLYCHGDETLDNIDRVFEDAFEDLRERVFRKQSKKRALGTISFTIGGPSAAAAAAAGAAAASAGAPAAGAAPADGGAAPASPTLYNIPLKVYCLFREARKDAPVFLNKVDNTRISSRTRWVCSTTGAYLEPSDIEKYHVYGGEQVLFRDDELKQIKRIVDPGLVLMGFKPIDAIRPELNYRAPYFLYPDETSAMGATAAIHSLILAMHDLKQCAIARFVGRRGAMPRFVALFPQLEERNAQGLQEIGPGLHLIFLPYADDIRNLRIPPAPSAQNQTELIRVAKRVINSLTLKRYDPSSICNPALQKHYAAVQAIALDESVGDDVMLADDELQPRTDVFEQHRALIEQFKQKALDPTMFRAYDAGAAGAGAGGAAGGGGGGRGGGAKRSRPAATADGADDHGDGDDGDGDGDGDGADGRGSARKRTKAETVDYSSIDWSTAQLDRLTVPQLKVYLRHHKLPLSGNKPDLVARVRAHLGCVADE